MRHVVAVLGFLALSASACVAPPDPVVPSTALVGLMASPTPDTRFCWAVATRDSTGAETASRGMPGAPADVDAALAAGDACASAGQEVEPIELACVPGPAAVVTRLVGAYGADGARLTDYIDPCGSEGCKTDFTCVAHARTPVDQNFTILRDADQGFLEIDISVADPGPVKDLCGTVRVVDGAGDLLWADDLCSSQFGNGRDSMMLIGPCSSGADTNVVTLWLDDPEPSGADPIAWTNPCPGSKTGADELGWSGGCSRTVTCLENEDVTVGFDFRAPAPR